MTRKQLIENLIEKHGSEAELPKTYAELFTLGELLEMVSEKQAEADSAVIVCPPMTETEWWLLPAAVRYFHPVERALQPLVMATQEGGI